MSNRNLTISIALLLFSVNVFSAQQPGAGSAPQHDGPAGNSAGFVRLAPQNYRAYVQQFAQDEQEATGKAPADEWPWIAAQVPLFESSDKQFEEMYYFRWYAWEKHLVKTDRGFLITEWMPKPALAARPCHRRGLCALLGFARRPAATLQLCAG
jgi:hypothetical protein